MCEFCPEARWDVAMMLGGQEMLFAHLWFSILISSEAAQKSTSVISL